MTKQQLQDKRILKQRIQDYLGEDRRVLAVQLNGFTHTIYFDNNPKGAKRAPSSICVLRYSGCVNEVETQVYKINTELKQIFVGYPNYAYQNNAIEFVYIHPKR